MKTVTIAPGLTVNETQYELVVEGLARYAPDAPALTWENWTAPSRWGLVPDEDTGRCYKAEFTWRDHGTDPSGTLLRCNIWFEPDLRDKGRPRPHSHPWPFRAHVLNGGYDEYRYTQSSDGIELAEAAHRPGDVNDLPQDLFHEVTDLYGAPGETLTLMTATGPGVRGGWGYLDLDTAVYTPAPPPSDAFHQAWRTLNPHR